MMSVPPDDEPIHVGFDSPLGYVTADGEPQAVATGVPVFDEVDAAVKLEPLQGVVPEDMRVIAVGIPQPSKRLRVTGTFSSAATPLSQQPASRVRARRTMGSAEFEAGQRVIVQFDRKGSPQDFAGTVQLARFDGRYEVEFDEGDTHAVQGRSMRRAEVTLLPMSPAPPPPPMPPPPAAPPPAPPTLAGEKSTVQEDGQAADSATSVDSVETQGEQAAEAAQQALQAVYAQHPTRAAADVAIKNELMECAARGEKSRFDKALSAERMAWLTEHGDGKTPVKVFRRMKSGNSPGGSIVEVLGGQSQHPFPKISKPNEFLKKGDSFIAGNNGFNPYLPPYARADGFVEAEFMSHMGECQASFPLFRECPRKGMFPESAYHGKSAEGGRLYLGEYKQDRDSVEPVLHFKDYPQYTQHYRVDWEVRVDEQRADDMYYEDGPVCPEDDCYEIDDDGSKKWLTFQEYYELMKTPLINSEDKAALLREQRSENARLTLVPITCCGYNWQLYDALVAVGAQASLKGRGKQVSLDPDELGSL